MIFAVKERRTFYCQYSKTSRNFIKVTKDSITLYPQKKSLEIFFIQRNVETPQASFSKIIACFFYSLSFSPPSISLLVITTPLQLPALTVTNISFPKSHIVEIIGRYIWDLWDQTVDVNGNAQDWTYSDILSSATSLTTSSCNGGTVFGGPDIFPGQTTLQRTYSDLPSHNFVYYSLGILAIDSWQSSDKFSIIIDGTTVSTWTPASYMSTHGSQSVCGGSSDDLVMTIVGKRSHSKSSLTLKLSFDIESQEKSGASFAIYNAVFSFPTANITDTATTNICFSDGCLIQKTLVPTGSYIDSSSSEQASCDSSCSECFNKGSDQCYKCAEGTYSFDGSNCINCPQNCFQCSSSTTCTRCLADYVLDSDGSCKASCSASDDIEMGNSLGTKVCTESPCSSSEYIRWDYTCQSSCDSPPYTQRASDSLLYCEYPCSYLQYLYENGSCIYSCSFLYTKRVDSGTKYCEIPCEGSEFVYEDGSCEATCPYYMISVEYPQDNITMCLTPSLDEEERKEVENLVRIGNIGKKMTSIMTKIASIISPSNPTYITSGLFFQMMSYIRFMNITHSGRLEVYLAFQDLRADIIFPNAGFLDNLSKHFTNKPLPYMFTKYGLHLSFVVNYANGLFLLLIYFGAVFLLLGLLWMARVLRNIPYIRSFLRITKIIMLNYFIGQVYMRYGEIVFYSGISFRFIALNDGNMTLSFLVAICCVFTGVFFFCAHVYIIHRYKKRPKGSSLMEFTQENPGTQIFYGSFKEDSGITQAFLLFAILRITIFSSIVALLFDYPMFQIYLVTSANVIFLGFVLVKRSFISLVEFIQQIIFEMSLLSINFSYLVLAIYDSKEDPFSSSAFRTSEGVLYLSVAGSFFPVLFLALRVGEAWWIWGRKSNQEVAKRVKVYDEATTVGISQKSSLAEEEVKRTEGEKQPETSQGININSTEEVPIPIPVSVSEKLQKVEEEPEIIQNEEDFKKSEGMSKAELSFLSSLDQSAIGKTGNETERELLSSRPLIEKEVPYSLPKSYLPGNNKEKIENSNHLSVENSPRRIIIENSKSSLNFNWELTKRTLDKSKLKFEWILEDDKNNSKITEVKKFKK